MIIRYLSLLFALCVTISPPLAANMLVEKRILPTSHLAADHRPILIHNLGKTLEFEDGSHWMIRPQDRYKVINGAWMPGDTIIVKNGHYFSLYPYVIINYNTCDETCEIEVQLDKGPTKDGYYSLFLADIDYFNYELYLSDGSTWDVLSKDHWILDQWTIGQHVIVGINDSWFNSEENILINPKMGNHIRASCKE